VRVQLTPASVLSAALLLLFVLRPTAESAPPPAPPSPPALAELWTDPVDLDRIDLSIGRWGASHAPDPRERFTYIRPKQHGHSPGMVVEDRRHRTWHVKQGREGQPEVVMSRVLSAIGYRQPPVYYLPSFTVVDGSGTHAAAGGRFRLSDPSLQDRGAWQWESNPFVGARPFQALLVILVLLNSADLKNSNNTMYEVTTPGAAVRRWFVVRDLGTSLGAVGRINPSPNDPEKFEQRRFVTGISHGYVEFGDYHAVHNELVYRRITPDDVRWASRLLGRLTERQWDDAFYAAGYRPALAQRFVRRIMQKIEEGASIGSGPVRSFEPVRP